MNTLAQTVTNVGTRVGDTSTAFATEIKKYINFRYKGLWDRFNWGTVKMDYTITTVAGTQDYKLEDGFFKPLYCYDSTNQIDIPELSVQDIERINASSLNDSGQPLKYSLYTKTNATTGVLEKYIRLFPKPSSVITVALPYQVEPTNMTADSALPIIDCDYAIELGATAEAWRTKRQFAKAADFDQQYEAQVLRMIWKEENSQNKIVQFRPKVYDKDLLY